MGSPGENKMKGTDLYRGQIETWDFFFLKGIIHQIMKVLSSFTQPNVVLNLYDYILPKSTKEKGLKNTGQRIQ